MKFVIDQEVLFDVFAKMQSISLSGIAKDFQQAGRLTIEVLDDKVNFWTTNGHMDARCVITAVSDCEPGISTVNVAMGKNIVKSLGNSKDPIAVAKKDNGVGFKNQSKKKRIVRMPTLGTDHVGSNASQKLSVNPPAKSKFKHIFNANDFCRGVLQTAGYKGVDDATLEYFQVCFHFFPDKVRFVGGDGMRFCIIPIVDKGNSDKRNTSVDEKGIMLLLPADQCRVLTNIIDGGEVLLNFKDKKTCYIKTGNFDILLKGIPDVDYIDYFAHAYRHDDAFALVDVDREDLADAIGVVESVKDKDLIQGEGSFHSCIFQISQGENLELIVDEDTYQCEVVCETAKFTPLGKETKYESSYSSQFLREVVASSEKPTIRFWCIEEDGIMIAAPVELDNDGNLKADIGTAIEFFFAAATEGENE
ncbi:hypothetical protein LCGC14_1227260 [marine sediment metagenome]|uniref:DNA polymerase III beta sliding clamp central domain-containing protein n=1 Tax=marine sediment metagenome TaxID=412755 RepID=A0A0F9LWQ4_9ZZZZ